MMVLRAMQHELVDMRRVADSRQSQDAALMGRSPAKHDYFLFGHRYFKWKVYAESSYLSKQSCQGRGSDCIDSGRKK
jgi:hypothetical protein